MSTPGVVRASNVLYAIFVLSSFVSIIGEFSNLEDIAGVVLNERESAHVDGMAPSSNHFPLRPPHSQELSRFHFFYT